MIARILFVALLVGCCDLSAQVVDAPTTAEPGEAVIFRVADAEPGDQIRWQLFTPRNRGVRLINTKYGVELVADPPCDYVGPLEIQVTVVNFDRQKFYQEIFDCQITGPLPDPVPPDDDPDPFDPDPVDPPADEYTGPNQYGLGKIAWENAPTTGIDSVAMIYERAAEYLYGRPELKVIFTDDAARNATEYNVFVWIAAEMNRSADASWEPWHRRIMESMRDAYQGGKITTNADWYGAFREIRSGIKERDSE